MIEAATQELGRIYSDIYVAWGELLGTPQSLAHQSCNRGKDWTISIQALIDLREGSTTTIEIISVDFK